MKSNSTLGDIGVRGAVKSFFYSIISPESMFDLNGQLQTRMRNPDPLHPGKPCSVFTIEPRVNVEHTGDDHAIIGPKPAFHSNVDLNWDVVLLDDC